MSVGSGLVAAILVGVALVGIKSEAPVNFSGFTALSGIEIGSDGITSTGEVVVDGFTQGGGLFATSTTGTLTEAQLLANNGIYITATGAGQATLSLTLPATSTMSTLIPTAGDCRDWWIDASDVAAATTTTVVAGAGWNIVGLDATGAGTGADVIDGAEFGRLTACRATDTDVTGFIHEYIHAD